MVRHIGDSATIGRFLPISAWSPQKKCSLNTSVNGTAYTRGSPGQASPRGSAASPRLLERGACACYYAGRRGRRGPWRLWLWASWRELDDDDYLRNADVHGAGRQDARGDPAVEPVWLPRPAQGRVRQEAGGLLHLGHGHVASTGAPVEVRRRCRPPSALGGAVCGYRFYRRVCRPVPPLGPDPGGQAPDRGAVGAPSLSRRGTRHGSPFVARLRWRRRGVSPRCGRAHRLHRREPLRGVLVPMVTLFALLHTART